MKCLLNASINLDDRDYKIKLNTISVCLVGNTPPQSSSQLLVWYYSSFHVIIKGLSVWTRISNIKVFPSQELV